MRLHNEWASWCWQKTAKNDITTRKAPISIIIVQPFWARELDTFICYFIFSLIRWARNLLYFLFLHSFCSMTHTAQKSNQSDLEPHLNVFRAQIQSDFYGPTNNCQKELPSTGGGGHSCKDVILTLALFFCNTPEPSHFPKNPWVLWFPARSPNSLRNFVFLLKQAFLELSPTVTKWCKMVFSLI